MKSLVASVAALIGALALSTLAAAAPLSYSSVNVPMDTPQALAGAVITAINANVPTAATLGAATGSAGASTLNGVRGTVTTESLSTAALTDFTETLTNSSINASSQVFVTLANGTNSAGDPIVAQVNPGAGSATIVIRNAHATNALNGTLKISFLVVN